MEEADEFTFSPNGELVSFLRGDMHGVIDDNRHMQNTLQFTYELQRAGKPSRLMLYEKSRHAVADPLLVKHRRPTIFDFRVETLLSARPPASTNDAAQARR